ncbi:MAG TPA: hypothetical protein VLH10_25955 [Yinghuangia sp.]|nr:hypothetical protein [Yinghuangia sp.]
MRFVRASVLATVAAAIGLITLAGVGAAVGVTPHGTTAVSVIGASGEEPDENEPDEVESEELAG